MNAVKRRHLLVTGGTGFIGRRLARRLSEQENATVITIPRGSDRDRAPTVDCIDLRDFEQVQRWAARTVPQGLDGVFHLAADVPGSFDSVEARTSFGANVAMTEAVLHIAEEHHCPFVFASSASVYGARQRAPVDETAPVEPDNPYSQGKLVGEELLQRAHERSGIATASLRIAAPYGPGQRQRTVVGIFLDAAVAGRDITVHGSGERTQDFTYVDDVVEACWLAYSHQANGVFNVSGGRPVSMKQLAELVLQVTGSSSRIVLGSQPDPQEDYRGAFRIDKARRMLAYEPKTGMQEGLKRCLAARTLATVT